SVRRFVSGGQETTPSSPLPLDDALPISRQPRGVRVGAGPHIGAQLVAARPPQGGDLRRVGRQRRCRVEPGEQDVVVLGLDPAGRSEEHTSELQSRENIVCRLLLEKKKKG